MTNGTAEAMAKETAATAVADRLGTICLAQLNRDASRNQKLLEVKGKDAWETGRFIEKQSWAVMPGDEKVETGRRGILRQATCKQALIDSDG